MAKVINMPNAGLKDLNAANVRANCADSTNAPNKHLYTQRSQSGPKQVECPAQSSLRLPKAAKTGSELV